MCLPVAPFAIEREWISHGLKCAVVLAREQGHRCGYVRLPPGHAAWGKGIYDVEVDVHCGLTFSGAEDCVEEDGRGWWLGFDCHHAFDLGVNPDVPADYMWLGEEARQTYEILSRTIAWGGHYWTLPQVAAETEKLAEQLTDPERFPPS